VTIVRTSFTDLLGIGAPLVGFNRSPGVVAAVTNAGGLGVLGATAYRPDELDAQLTWIEEQVQGRPYGVDLLVPAATVAGDPHDLVASLRAQIPDEHVRFVEGLLQRYGIDPGRFAEGLGRGDDTVAAIAPTGVEALLDVAFSHDIALVANALGPPPPLLVERAKEAGVVVAALVGEARHAVRQLDEGVDVLVAQGTEAGGHTGSVATMVLAPEIVDLAGDVPVLAAGGIASGRQMAAALALGAAGVWCGSVWLNSVEDITPAEIKRKFVVARSTDTVRSATRTGKPARQLRSAWHDAWESAGAPAALPMPLQLLLAKDAWSLIDEAAAAGSEGARELESFFVGQVVGSFGEPVPAGEIVRAMVSGCERRIAELAGALS
jgi:NAD(P)H-dependent flavin oxidoreductase YrpB (nitropropane dioxygenase family)